MRRNALSACMKAVPAFLLALALVLWLLPGRQAAAQGNALVRVVHASPAAGNVDVFVDGGKLLSNFAFGTVTDYVSVAAGPHRIQVAPAGKGIDAAVINETVSVDADMAYTVAAIGDSASNLGLQAFVDNNQLSSGMAKVRVYHLSPNAGPVDIATGGKTVISGLTYKNASDYLSVPPGSYTFNVTATQANATVPVSATLQSGMVYSVFAVGLYKGTPALKFVVAAVSGVPGMPNTGSDPNALPQSASTTTVLPWVSGLIALGALGALGAGGWGIMARRRRSA
ncbi:MAG: DUF4397 domain-containing protein [Thermogemmatispora sp.]|uniref:DUF4397 domain-containing protein n=1 Tax=Thermogemmatispora sp. TaxID=1968838 RepID=UPI0019F849D2|nr:DUF4397 domain-containing protein [Thermogemmatispora sp.]MBE3567153.1 DUF4397 domain-containing protein [Thermogemmatispora sp.]